MKNIKSLGTKKKATKVVKDTPVMGRKRDPALESLIIEATLEILAEVGFDQMTMDMVASKAKSGKATVYRRWGSKAEMVRDAMIWMSKGSVEVDQIPDTGDLLTDLISLMKPRSMEYNERKLLVLSKMGSFFSEHKDLAQEAMSEIFGPWTTMNMKIFRRAKERGELKPKADLELACKLIVSTVCYTTVAQNEKFDKAAYTELLEKILLPAIRK